MVPLNYLHYVKDNQDYQMYISENLQNTSINIIYKTNKHRKIVYPPKTKRVENFNAFRTPKGTGYFSLDFPTHDSVT